VKSREKALPQPQKAVGERRGQGFLLYYNYMSGGRPTKYHDGIIALAEEYLRSCSRENTTLPTVEGLALHLEVDDDTINEWAKEHEEFSATIKKLKAKQKAQLMDDGLYGGKEVNSTMAIFLLKVNHGMVETTRQEHTGKDGEPIKVEEYKYENLQKWIVDKAKQMEHGDDTTTD
jgi:hypothetical protein